MENNKILSDIGLLSKFMTLQNIAPELEDDQLTKIGQEVFDGYETDEDSRQKWKDTLSKALAISMQIMDKKDTPWPNASNIKYPLLPVGCLQFNARMLPEVIKGDKAAKTTVYGKDPEGKLAIIGEVISKHLSYQLLEEIENWAEDVDKLLMILPLFGHIFKKVYYDSLESKPAITLCLPHEIVVNQSVQSLQKASRISHLLQLSANDIFERIEAGLFVKEKEKEIIAPQEIDTSNLFPTQIQENPDIATVDYIDPYHHYIEQQCYFDLDNDGYKEPYIVTINKETHKVARIVANYDKDSFIVKDGKIIRIKRKSYFTDYRFFPAPDGTYYGIGFGKLLYPLNEAVNTLFNQLIDAGTLSNRGGGFINDKLGWAAGSLTFQLGEFKKVSVPMGTNLAQSIFPVPVKDPSAVLFQLLGMLMEASKEVSNVSDVLQGQQPAQNVPATTVLALIEQGQKVYSAIQKRIYISMKKELRLLAELNKSHQNDPEYFGAAIKLGIIDPTFYELENVAIFPVVDPAMSSQTMRLAKAQSLMETKDEPEVNKWEILREYFEAIGVENILAILPEPKPPQPSAEEEKIMAEAALIKMKTADVLYNMDVKAYRYLLDQKQLEVNAAQVAGINKQMEHTNIIAHQKLAIQVEELMREHGAKTIDADLQLSLQLLANLGKNLKETSETETTPPEEEQEEKASVLATTPGVKEMPIPSEEQAQAQTQNQPIQGEQSGAPNAEGMAPSAEPQNLPLSKDGDNINIPTTSNEQKPSPAGTQDLIDEGKI